MTKKLNDMSEKEVKDLQRDLNRFTGNSKYLRNIANLKVDGDPGPATRDRIRDAKFFLGYVDHDDAAPHENFRWRLEHPTTVRRGDHRKGDLKLTRRGRARRIAQRNRVLARATDTQWGGCRYWTNRVIRIVNGRYAVTSRKRSETYGNPTSDHHVSQTQADAVDFATANNHSLKNEISGKIGGPSQIADYNSFTTRRLGRSFRHQPIAGTHGTGPHLHWGVRRIG